MSGIGAGPGGSESDRRTPAPFGRRRCTVRANEPVGRYSIVSVGDPQGPAPRAGQFYMLAGAEGWGGNGEQRPYLPRALSVCRVRVRELDFLVEVVGPGTAALAALRPGDEIWLAGPLGIGFRAPAELLPGEAQARALLVGGGAGVAPLVAWEQTLAAAAVPAKTVLGFRSADWSEAAGLFGGDVGVATDDGSGCSNEHSSHRGPVTDLLAAELDAAAPGGDAVIYACGPPAMLEAVRRISAERPVPAELALEARMACGFGACFGCVVRTRSGYRRLCVDGPVLSADDLDSEWMGH